MSPPLTGFRPGGPVRGFDRPRGQARAPGTSRGLRTVRPVVLAAIAGAALLLTGLIAVPMLVVGGSNMLFAAGGNCAGGSGSQNPTTTAASSQAKNSIPANYLALLQRTGQQYRVPWPILAGIGKVESDFGRSTLPGVHSGSNAFGAAGPMQIGIGGAAGNVWGGAPVHPASEQVSGVATDANGDGTASVYDPADAIAGAAMYLVRAGVLDNPQGAIFAYNHLISYVQAVVGWASTYAAGGYTVSAVSVDAAAQCLTGSSGQPPNQAVSTIIAYAQAQLGKPYQWGATGPDAFDCSGLVMMAYRAVGINIPRTSQEQWAWGPRIQASQVQPGDLAFFAGADGTATSPGHVGLVIGKNLMIEAYATGFPVRIASYAGRDPVGFTRPWAHSGVVLTGQGSSGQG